MADYDCELEALPPDSTGTSNRPEQRTHDRASKEKPAYLEEVDRVLSLSDAGVRRMWRERQGATAEMLGALHELQHYHNRLARLYRRAIGILEEQATH